MRLGMQGTITLAWNLLNDLVGKHYIGALLRWCSLCWFMERDDGEKVKCY